MRIIATGRGTSGSWQIRGAQLCGAIGATLAPSALHPYGFDAAILVKRPSPGLLERLQRAKLPIIWDVVDAYPQPAALAWTYAECSAWLRAQLDEIRPAAVVAATADMADDIARVSGVPTLWLPHHSRPGLRANPIYRDVRTVGYEGSDHYLGKWLHVMQEQCAHRGWRFRVNPAHLADLDIVVALRDAGGYAARFWKSGVKLANAIGSGTPAIIGAEMGCRELAPVGMHHAETAADVARLLDELEPQSVRQEMATAFAARAPSLALAAVAARYAHWLGGLSL